MPEHSSCRICGSSDLTQFLDMGMMPLANGLLDSLVQPEERYPLNVLLCEKCGLVQLGYVVPPEKLFYSNYPFFTSSSKVMSRHFIDLMDEHAAQLKPNDLIVEVGSNDCTSFIGMNRTDLRRVGVDPASNMPIHGAHVARQIVEPFTEELANYIIREQGAKASLVVACNVLGHVDDLHDFMRGVTSLLADDGEFVFEVPKLADTLSNGQYDQFYHEHLSYFSITPLLKLLNMHGLEIVREKCRRVDVHGGSLRIVARRGSEWPSITDDNYPLSFASTAIFWRDNLRDRILSLKSAGKTIIGYGASAKGAVVLNYCGIGVGLVPFVIDTTPAKQKKYMPGTHQWIMEDRDLSDEDSILLLAWNHAAEIKAKHPEFKGEWILPHGDA